MFSGCLPNYKNLDRAEMLCKVEELRREMESRLDSQRRHMVQKESHLKNEVEELKVNRKTRIPLQTIIVILEVGPETKVSVLSWFRTGWFCDF